MRQDIDYEQLTKQLYAELEWARRRINTLDSECARYRREAVRLADEADHLRRMVEAREEFDATVNAIGEGRL